MLLELAETRTKSSDAEYLLQFLDCRESHHQRFLSEYRSRGSSQALSYNNRSLKLSIGREQSLTCRSDTNEPCYKWFVKAGICFAAVDGGELIIYHENIFITYRLFKQVLWDAWILTVWFQFCHQLLALGCKLACTLQRRSRFIFFFKKFQRCCKRLHRFAEQQRLTNDQTNDSWYELN